jgi:voltage-gated potassium channel Kch
MNLVDAVTTGSFYIQIFIAAGGNPNAGAFSIFLYVLRMLRVFRITRYHNDAVLIRKALYESSRMLLLFFLGALVIIFISATAYFYAEVVYFDENLGMWMRLCPQVFPMYDQFFNLIPQQNCTYEVSPTQSIGDAMYWSIVTLTTVGFRAEAPVTNLGKVIAAATIVLGIAFYAAPTMILTTNYREMREEIEEKITHLDRLMTEAMIFQERLRLAMEHAYNFVRDSNGREVRETRSRHPVTGGELGDENVGVVDHEQELKIEHVSTIVPVCAFEYQRKRHVIFEVVKGAHYIYEPLLELKRQPDGSVSFSDEFNLHSGERLLCVFLVMDNDSIQVAARKALVRHGIIDRDHLVNDVLVEADRSGSIQITHDYAHVYPDMRSVVFLDALADYQSAANTDGTMRFLTIRFVVVLPHLHGAEDCMELLRRTRLHVSLGIRKKQFLMEFPMHTSTILSSRLVRELHAICCIRRSDGHQVAYVHPADAAMLLEGFCDQFVPTPSADVLIVAPQLVDQQVYAALRSSFPTIRLADIPIHSANSCYRSAHLNIHSGDQNVMEVDITSIRELDETGLGRRFQLSVLTCEEHRYDACLSLEAKLEDPVYDFAMFGETGLDASVKTNE